MANWNGVLQSDVRGVLYEKYSKMTRAEVEEAKKAAEDRIDERLRESLDDAFVSDRIDRDIIGVCTNLLDTRVKRDFTNFTLEVNGMTLTLLESDLSVKGGSLCNCYKVVDKTRGIDAICGFRYKGKGVRKYVEEIEKAIWDFEKYMGLNAFEEGAFFDKLACNEVEKEEQTEEVESNSETLKDYICLEEEPCRIYGKTCKIVDDKKYSNHYLVSINNWKYCINKDNISNNKVYILKRVLLKLNKDLNLNSLNIDIDILVKRCNNFEEIYNLAESILSGSIKQDLKNPENLYNFIKDTFMEAVNKLRSDNSYKAFRKFVNTYLQEININYIRIEHLSINGFKKILTECKTLKEFKRVIALIGREYGSKCVVDTYTNMLDDLKTFQEDGDLEEVKEIEQQLQTCIKLTDNLILY